MHATITVRMDNAAFGDEGENAGFELARILRDLAHVVEDCPGADLQHYTLRDANGNRVGDFNIMD